MAAGKTADEDVRWYIFGEVAEAQANHGYYADAFETWRLVDRYPDQLFVKLVGIQAGRGDVAGARKMASGASPGYKSRAEEAVAIAQANRGDFSGALETARNLRDKTQVLAAIGAHQVETNDLEGALKTAAEMGNGWSDDIYYAVAGKLRRQGKAEKADEVARRISDPDMAESALARAGKSENSKVDPCQSAVTDAEAGRVAEAYEKLDGNACECSTVAYVHEKARDATGAARLMHACPNLPERSLGMAQLAQMAARQGDVQQALKFAEEVHVSGATYEEGYLAPALRVIGHAWAEKTDKEVLKWARSRPTGFEKAMSLLGVAEGIKTE